MGGREKVGAKGAERGVAGSVNGDPGYLDQEVVGCQFSVYPLQQDDIGPAIRAAISAAQSEGCSVRVGNLSTLVTGSEDQVFRALRGAFRAAQRAGSSVMTATLAAGMPSDELVGEIQSTVDSQGSPSPGSPSSSGAS